MGNSVRAYTLVERDGEKFIEAETALQTRVLDLHRLDFSSRMIVAEHAKDGIPVCLAPCHGVTQSRISGVGTQQ